MGNHQKKELLEELRKAAHCDCISDLRGPERSVAHLVKRAEELLKTGDYALKEWTDAVQYITGSSWNFHDKEEAAGYLKSFSVVGLKQPKSSDKRLKTVSKESDRSGRIRYNNRQKRHQRSDYILWRKNHEIHICNAAR